MLFLRRKLANNPFECTCDISWFLDSIKNTNNSCRVIDLKTLKCSSPKRLRFKNLAVLKREDVCLFTKLSLTEIPANIATNTKQITEKTTSSPETGDFIYLFWFACPHALIFHTHFQKNLFCFMLRFR